MWVHLLVSSIWKKMIWTSHGSKYNVFIKMLCVYCMSCSYEVSHAYFSVEKNCIAGLAAITCYDAWCCTNLLARLSVWLQDSLKLIVWQHTLFKTNTPNLIYFFCFNAICLKHFGITFKLRFYNYVNFKNYYFKLRLIFPFTIYVIKHSKYSDY